MSDYLANLLRRPPVGWWDLLDIAVVSVLIYEFLKLIRGTRAVQMAVGSLFVVALLYVAQLAPLQTVRPIRNAPSSSNAPRPPISTADRPPSQALWIAFNP